MGGTDVKQRLAAILAADVAGYSRLMAADERATVAALDAARGVFREQIEANGGRVVDMAGDSVLAVFETAAGATLAALAIQRELEAASSAVPEARRMRFRLGLHLGDVIEKTDGTVYGDGVNVAARLQVLAAAGGIAVSEAVHAAVRNRVAAAFEDQGEHQAKNIAYPVRVYAVLPESQSARRAERSHEPGGASAKTSAEKPSIAVLPFQNISGDAEQEYFSDGITEDIITDLSKLSGLFVISRNSTFTYKGKAVDVREVGTRLDASHVLEGSVRRAGGRVRITAQLLDATSGRHLWAERYDRDLEDIFAMQDEITREVVAALDVKLLRGEQASAWRRLLRHPEALDAYYKGIDYLNRITREANDEAARCFEQVIRIEPDSPLGHLGLAWTQLSASRYGWGKAGGLERAARLSRKALELDADCADAHALLGYYHLLAGKHDEAIAAGERSVALNPNHADNAANLACSYLMGERPADAVLLMRKAMRLSPVHPAWYLNILGFAHYLLGQYAEAEEALRLALQREPAYTDCRLILAAALHARGRTDDARRELDEVKRREPGFRLRAMESRLSIAKDRTLVARLIALLRELGLE
ncbi:MAG TPA: tetratricopeptide repeat protein [Burkholderiales bacterium]|nr:tetratricopeptide repeat protein [Burkholderiales bacterium]